MPTSNPTYQSYRMTGQAGGSGGGSTAQSANTPTAEELELLLKEILAAIPFIINIQQPTQIAVGEVEEVEVPDLQEDLV